MSHYDTPQSMAQPEPGGRAEWRAILSNAIRYWEPRRLIYNAVLGLIVLAHWIDAPATSQTSHLTGGIVWLFLAAVGANICYCAAYGVDIFLQLSDFRPLWLRWRWALLLLGILAAAAATHITCLPFFRQPG